MKRVYTCFCTDVIHEGTAISSEKPENTAS